MQPSLFSQYSSPEAVKRYAELADALGLVGKTAEDKVQKFVVNLEDLKKKLDLPMTIKEAGVNEKTFLSKGGHVEELTKTYISGF